MWFALHGALLSTRGPLPRIDLPNTSGRLESGDLDSLWNWPPNEEARRVPLRQSRLDPGVGTSLFDPGVPPSSLIAFAKDLVKHGQTLLSRCIRCGPKMRAKLVCKRTARAVHDF